MDISQPHPSYAHEISLHFKVHLHEDFLAHALVPETGKFGLPNGQLSQSTNKKFKFSRKRSSFSSLAIEVCM